MLFGKVSKFAGPLHKARWQLVGVGMAAVATVTVGLGPVSMQTLAPQASAQATGTTAWQDGTFVENVGSVVSSSDIVLGAPNTETVQSLPLGNGSLGVAAWAANGFTAQLNRNDTMPNRLSPGQVNIPGLSSMTSASNFSGYLDLYNGVLHESGGGITMNAWVPASKDELIVDVSGVTPSSAQTATLSLWSGRSPATSTSGAYGALAQTWVDNVSPGGSGDTFGAMAAITAGGQNVSASVVSSTEVQVSFSANTNGTFRVVVAAPEWTGGTAITTAQSLIGSDATSALSTLLGTQASWWNNYWAGVGLIQASSSDGSAAYMENLRTLYLYDAAASLKTGQYPGSQAGVADMFEYDQDNQDWYPAGYWLWNLRGIIAANLSSGDFNLNIPIFNMYLNDLPAIESWTSAQMGGTSGACVPETMRYNGNGYYNGGNNTQNASCATASSPSYNALDITSGAELALWVWQQYEDTASMSFLQTYYPIMQEAAQFLLDYQSVGSDGFLHAVANAHETQWAVEDPTTDLAADEALFPATVQALTLVNQDSSLVSQLKTAENEIEPFPRASESNLTDLLNSQPTSASAAASDDAAGNDVIADSYQPSAALHNGENIGLEPLWPYGVIGDATTVNGDNLTALEDRTFQYRPNTDNSDWNFDAVDAARLDNASAVESNLVTLTEDYQIHISGLSSLGGTSYNDPYIEQQSTVATALDEALATDYDGTLRFAPAWPSGWSASGTIYIQGGSKVDVQVENGTLATAAIQAGSTTTMTVRNPWPGQDAEVVNGSTGAVVVSSTTATNFSVPVTAGNSYLVEQPSSPTTSLTFAPVTGTPATTYKSLGGKVQIGLSGNSVNPPAGTLGQAPYGGTPAAVPGTVYAANYDAGGQGVAYNVSSVNGSADSYRSDGVNLEDTSDTVDNTGAGAYDLGWTATGQWFNYTVDVATAGTYTVSLRLASPSGQTDAFHIASSAGTNLSGDVNAPDTGGWQDWATVTANVTLAAGAQTLTVDQDNGGWNIHFMSFAGGGTTTTTTTAPTTTTTTHPTTTTTTTSGGAPYGGTPAAVPGLVQAANYDTGGQGVAYNITSTNGTANSYRSDGVDLEATTDTSDTTGTGAGYDLGWTATGQWFHYTVAVATAGTYTVSLRLASPSGVTDALHIANSAGTNLSGDVNAPDTGGWQDWATATATVTLPAGAQTLTVDQDNGGWNIHYLSFAPAIVASDWYEVVNTNSGLCEGTAAAGTANGTAVEQLACNGSASQLWQFVATSVAGEYEVLNQAGQSGAESWNITGGVGATASGDLLQIWSYGGTGNTNALFAAGAQLTGSYDFIADNSALCLDTPSASTASGVQLEQYTCNATPAQEFNIVAEG
jgi:hypothetical protein